MKIISEEKKAKIKNRHHSIKTQMIMAFVGLLICLVVTLMFINGKFLEPYYISKKESRFIELYEKLNNVSNEDKWNSARKNSSLIHFAEKNNISYLVQVCADSRLAIYGIKKGGKITVSENRFTILF